VQTAQWIIFDVGGVVVPEMGDTIEREAAAAVGVPVERLSPLLVEPFRRATAGEITLEEMYRLALAQLGVQAGAERAIARHLEVYRQHCSRRVPGTLDLVARLRRRFHVACLTNTEPEIAATNKERGLFDPFERAFLSTDMRMRKPDPAIWTAVLRELACPAVEALYVDDRREYVEAAARLGMVSVRFRDAARLEQDLRGILGEF